MVVSNGVETVCFGNHTFGNRTLGMQRLGGFPEPTPHVSLSFFLSMQRLKDALPVLSWWCGVEQWYITASLCEVDTSVVHRLKDALAVLNWWCGVEQ